MTQNKKTIIVLGANGRLSSHVVRAFDQAGWHVIAVTRSGKCHPVLADLPNIEHRSADAMDEASLTKACEGADFIFNGLNPSSYAEWGEQALPMAKNVIVAVKSHEAIHLFPGNVYNYGSHIPERLSADTSFSPNHKKARIRCEMEKLFQRAAADEGLKTILIRAGDFYGGPQPGSWFDLALASKIEKGKFLLPGDPEAIHSWAYLPDLAASFVRIAEVSDKLSTYSQFNFEGHNVTGFDMKKAAEKAMGHSLKRGYLPKLFFTIAGLFNPVMRDVREMYYLWERPHAMDGGALEAVIGPRPHTSLDQAVNQALADLGKLQGRKSLSSLKTPAVL